MLWRTIHVAKHERGLYFNRADFVGVLGPGVHHIFDPNGRRSVALSSMLGWIDHPQLAVIVKSGALGGRADVLDLAQDERAIVFRDGRFDSLLGPGLYAAWKGMQDIRVERIKVTAPRFEHPELHAILASSQAGALLMRVEVTADQWGMVFVDGKLVDQLDPGVYAYWRRAGTIRQVIVDRRATVLEISGQEIMTSDKVTLRLNAFLSFAVTQPDRALSSSDDYRQALYREGQMMLRASVGTRDLDTFLLDKDALATEVLTSLREKGEALGVAVHSLGIKDIILPGEMKELLNKVTEAKKAAEAAMIMRREETAAIRSQLNSAKLYESNPTLMRMRELETLEKVSEKAQLTVVLGDKGLAERVVKMV
ncbi:MAG: slipin family protein [Myxococcota bacterium]